MGQKLELIEPELTSRIKGGKAQLIRSSSDSAALELDLDLDLSQYKQARPERSKDGRETRRCPQSCCAAPQIDKVGAGGEGGPELINGTAN
ncbi:uncharacterized protein PgNI_04772 [Pyricularia grisea]|uniref:Uncharacterized protein n=1 Tax=Pyricularia grisea TaxID=148305 RepID=A0A6P8BCM9_PYRGI|nr:uncharacterized protein PgNI_04772 [Pyricularia grisea]TLD13553.1 hypothetical protein PgNI_04772 [Pyricularia grisea]